jgi:hypothetical protein
MAMGSALDAESLASAALGEIGVVRASEWGRRS